MSVSAEEDVMRIKKRLEKMMKTNEIDVNVSIDMLNTMKKLQIDLQILKTTGIGVVLNNLRKSCNSEELGTLAKNLLKNWKKLVAVETGPATANSPNSNSNDSSTQPTKSPSTPSTTNGNGLKRTMSDSPEVKNESKNMKTENGSKAPTTIHKSSSHPTTATTAQQQRVKDLNSSMKFSDTRDPTRQKCREMLAQALEVTEPIENGAALCDVNLIAARCEEVIYNEFKGTDMKYKNRIRSRVINLKDSKNPKLRENVRLGLISPDKLAVMTAEEMASDDLKELRAKFTKEAIDDHQMARREGAKTSLLTCGKCKKNNIVYSEMQTRSADEPMTVFAFCQECGHRWKFS
ncbi:unnamed protein product [Brachionus calyciflorus]|uniref:Transcription elongation factor n=2 Tax=Brachionus TaxID=10194 RepID=A0A813WA93_9BILA|nr:unnamed protein product [Brachionus calyciflorus]